MDIGKKIKTQAQQAMRDGQYVSARPKYGYEHIFCFGKFSSVCYIIRNHIQDKFYDDIFAQAKTAVNDDLGEKSLKKSLMKQIQRSQKQQRSVDNKCRNHEFEQ